MPLQTTAHKCPGGQPEDAAGRAAASSRSLVNRLLAMSSRWNALNYAANTTSPAGAAIRSVKHEPLVEQKLRAQADPSKVEPAVWCNKAHSAMLEQAVRRPEGAAVARET